MSQGDRIRNAGVVIVAVVALIGVWGLVASRGMGMTEPTGALLGWRSIELGLLTLNPLGATLTLLTGSVGLAGLLLRRSAVVVGAAVVLLAMAVQVLVQWGGTPNVLGSRGVNFSFWAAAGIGLLTLSVAERWTREPSAVAPPDADHGDLRR